MAARLAAAAAEPPPTTDYGLRTTNHGPRTTGPALNSQLSTLHRFQAFTLIEILVTVALLSFIVLGLLAMFNQTQRAFRSSMTQAGVLEGGRNVAEMMARELEAMTPSYRSNELNFVYGVWGISVQGLPGSVSLRTNYVGYFSFLSGENVDWTGTGYFIDDVSMGGSGTLYRFATNRPASSPLSLSSLVLNALQAAHANALAGRPVTNCSRIADGVVHLQVRTFAPNGFPIMGYALVPPSYRLTTTNAYYRTNAFFDGCSFVRQTGAGPSMVYPDDLAVCYFSSNAVPAFVELELGILEPQILDRFKSIGLANHAAQLNYLSNHVAQVHLFRQRIPIRNVDFSAYP